MEQKRLRLYKLDMKYIRDLAKKDDRQHRTIAKRAKI